MHGIRWWDEMGFCWRGQLCLYASYPDGPRWLAYPEWSDEPDSEEYHRLYADAVEPVEPLEYRAVYKGFHLVALLGYGWFVHNLQDQKCIARGDADSLHESRAAAEKGLSDWIRKNRGRSSYGNHVMGEYGGMPDEIQLQPSNVPGGEGFGFRPVKRSVPVLWADQGGRFSPLG